MSEGEHGAGGAGHQRVGNLLEGVQLGGNVGMDLARERAREAMFGLRTAEIRVDRFVLEREVGEGGMGVVYAAHDPSLDRKVAVKLVHASRSDGSRGERARARMVSEARALAQVSHPNVVEVFEVGLHRTGSGEDGEQVFVAMEFIEGGTVRQWLAAQPRRVEEILAVYLAAGRGLAAVHDEGLVHRDFKPDNVMVGDDGRIRVMDFGLAQGLAEDAPSLTGLLSPTAYASLTATGDVQGTPAYMAPEQFAGAVADPRSDQYSFCVAIYEALWKERPSVADGEPPPNPPRKTLPRRQREALLRGLSREPQQRFASMHDLLEALRPPRSTLWLVLGVVGVVAVLGAAGLAWMLAHAPVEQSPCTQSAQNLEGTWSDPQAQRVRDAFADSSKSGAERSELVVERLDAYAQRWVEGHTDACEAALVERIDTDAIFDKRMRCLQRRKQSLGALVDVLVAADERVVARAEDAVAELRPVERCADPAFLEAMTEPPADPATAAEVEQIDRALAEVRALRDTGRVDEARARVEPLTARASAIGYPPLLAQVALAHGELEFRVGNAAAAKPLYEQAYFQAKDAGDAGTAIWAAVSLAMSQATFANEQESANHWLRLARTEIEASKITGWEVRILDIEVALLDSQGDFDGALAAARERVERLGEDCGDACTRQAEAQSDLALAYSRLGHRDEAITHARKGVELAQAQHGSQHPRVAETLSTLGDVLLQAGRAAEASEMLGQALEIRERLLEPDAASLQMTRLLFANALVEQGRTADGLEQMLAVRASLGDGAGALISSNIDNQIAWAQQSLGRFDEARRTFMGAVEGMRELYPQGHPSLSIMLSNVAGIDRDTGNYAAALEGFEEAMAMRQNIVEGADPLRATFLLNIAEMLAKLERKGEAIERYAEAVSLTTEGALDLVGLRVRLRLASLVVDDDPARAKALVEEGRRRCGVLSPAQKEAARCHVAQMWPDKPAETP
ncbi:MAG: serine/threonine-protein kinase [Myxococcota bacterium]